MAEGKDVLVKDDWASEQGKRWLANVDRFEAMIAPIGDALMARAAFTPGERVVDIGCGGGETTRAIAAAVSPGGAAHGVDISPDLVAYAKGNAGDTAGLSYECADAATVTLDHAPYDRLFSRFGSMFFDDPHGAFTNLKAMLKPGARIDLAVWAAPRDNAWMMELMGVLRKHVEVPPAEPRMPGPFAFEDLTYLEEVLGAGGFSALEVEPYHGKQAIGGHGATAQEAVDFVLGSLGIGQILKEQSAEIQAAAEADLLAMFEAHYVAGEGALLDCKVWLVSAKA